MPELRTDAFIAVAIAALVMPLAFVVAVVLAAMARRGGRSLGPATSAGLALLGGLALGSMFLIVASEPAIAFPIPLAAVLLLVNEWRSGRRASAGWLLAGFALPWMVLWGAYLVLLATGVDFDPPATVLGFAAGALPAALGLVVAGRYAGGGPGDRDRDRPRRSFRTLAMALGEPSRVGPVALPDLAAVVALVVSGLAVSFLVRGVPTWAGFLLAVIIGAAAASEAYLQAMAPRSRRATEAFMWLGSWDLAAIKAITGEGVPTTRRGAERWLASHPVTAEEPPLVRSMRLQLLLLANRLEEARALAADEAPAEPAGAPSAADRFHRASDRQFVGWYAGDPGTDVAAMAAEAEGILPPDGDERLRADVTVALARVRDMAVADPPTSEDALAPLLAMRDRLGTRADGLMRRLIWRRLFTVFFVAGLALGAIGLALGVAPA
jgi:hypothetical protein